MPTPEQAPNPAAPQAVHRWLRERAAADGQMRRAAAWQDAAPGAAPDSGGARDVTAVLTRDHNRITAMARQLDAIPGRTKGGSAAQVSRRQSIVRMISAALAGHEPAEQEYLWPAVRRRLSDGGHLADQALRQEREGEQTLAALAHTAPDTEMFDVLVERLVAQLRRHIAFEDMVFARLRAELRQKDRDRLGKKVRKAQQAAQARLGPHPARQPPSAAQTAGATAAGSGWPAGRRGTAYGSR